MTDIDTLPKYHELFRPTLDGLTALGGSAAIDELADWVAAHLGITEHQLEIVYPKSGDSVFRDRLSWARSFLKQAGYVDNSSRGVWTLTPDGRAVTDEQLASVPREVARKAKAKKGRNSGSAG